MFDSMLESRKGGVGRSQWWAVDGVAVQTAIQGSTLRDHYSCVILLYAAQPEPAAKPEPSADVERIKRLIAAVIINPTCANQDTLSAEVERLVHERDEAKQSDGWQWVESARKDRAAASPNGEL